MEQVFAYIISLGAAVMMPVIFTVLGVCIGIRLGDALKSGLKVGVGFVGLSIVTALLTSALGPALNSVVDIYDLQLGVFDMGWPAAATVAYNTAVGAFIIPVCLGVNLLMLLTKTTRTVNIDLWTTLVVSLLLIPVTLALAVLLPGNKFLPLASLAGMFYVFPLVLPFTRGNVVKTFIIGLVVLTLGLYMVTNLAPAFTLAANDVHKATGDGAVAIPEGFAQGGSLDFASSPLAWVIYQAVHNLKWIGSGLLVLATMALMWWNRVLILRSQNNQKPENN